MEDLVKVTNGKVSARELYLGLGLNKTHWKRWYESNIENNEFFLENDSWRGFAIMASGNEVKDFEITLEFAKHIAMMARTAKSHEYRNYFIDCEKFISESKLTEEFKYYRKTGKIARRELTDTIKDVLHPKNQFTYINYTKLIYNKLFGMTVKQLRESKGLKKSDNLRDFFTPEELGQVLALEKKVEAYIVTLHDMELDNKEVYSKINELINK